MEDKTENPITISTDRRDYIKPVLFCLLEFFIFIFAARASNGNHTAVVFFGSMVVFSRYALRRKVPLAQFGRADYILPALIFFSLIAGSAVVTELLHAAKLGSAYSFAEISGVFRQSQAWEGAIRAFANNQTAAIQTVQMLAAAFVALVITAVAMRFYQQNTQQISQKSDQLAKVLESPIGEPDDDWVAPAQPPIVEDETTEDDAELAANCVRIVVAAKACYETFELGANSEEIIYFANTSGYVDSFLELVTSGGVVTSCVVAYTIPPNTEIGDWMSYRLEVIDPETTPSLAYIEEIAQDGTTKQLDLSYSGWVADCAEEVLAGETVTERPPQMAPAEMY